MSICRDAALAVTLVSLAAVPEPAWAAGPGLGNQPCQPGELFKEISVFDHSNGTPDDSPSKAYGHNVVVMTGGYLMLLFAPDSGHPTGGLLFYDVSQPRSPVLARSLRNDDTAAFRETHSLPMARVGDRFYLALQTVTGIQIWDVSDPMAAARIGELALEGVDAGDYDNVAWQLSWQYPYLFVSGSGDGFHVVDTSDPSQPQLVKRVPISATGGFRIGPIFAIGDYLVVSNMDQDGHYALLDISNPADPQLLDTVGDMPKIYSMAAFGDRIYGAGRNGDFLIHEFGPAGIRPIKSTRISGDGLYLSYQDGFIHYGQTDGYKKLDVHDENDPKIVGEALISAEHADHGQTTPFGNLVFIGNDHGTGSALVCHAAAPDTTPPSVLKHYPADGTTHQPRTSRISISFSDNIDLRSVDADSFVVRKAGGAAVPGAYSYLFNTVSFGPAEPFEPDTTYEVVLSAGGVSDAVGNALAEPLVTRFSTGAAVVVPPPPPDAGLPPPDAATTEEDAGGPAAQPDAEGGCGCRTAGGPGAAGTMLLLALPLVLLRIRRRKP